MTVSQDTWKNTDPSIMKEEEKLRSSDPDLMEEESLSVEARPYVALREGSSETYPFRFIPLYMGGSGRTHVATEDSASLMEEVSLKDLEKLTKKFYEKAFKDPTLDKFIRSHTDPHGERFAKWIHQKLSGSTVWDEDRANRDNTPVEVAEGRLAVVHDRSSAHAAAWYSKKRPAHEVGRHFELDECRVWMRLHFWALRESGLIEKSPSFADYYLRFIAHFVRVYESTAPMFARDSFRWSSDPKNIQRYLANGRKMDDVMGLTLEEAARKIPKRESQGVWWPYNHTQEKSDFQ